MGELIYKRNEISGGSAVMTKIRVSNPTELPHVHWHSYFEVIRVLESCVRVFLDGDEICLGVGDCVLISPGCSHDSVSLNDAEPAKIQVLQFYLPAGVSSRLGVGSSMSMLLYSISSRERFIRRGDRFSRQAEFLCDEIFEQTSNPDKASEDIIEGAVQMLLGYFTCDSAAHMLSCCKDSGFDMVKICEYIDKNLLSGIDLEGAASYIGYSKAYFSHKFKDAVGIGFKEYIDRLRMHEARRMLGEGKSATETAAILGYDSVQNFSRAFKRINRMTPRETMLYKR